MVGAVPEDLGVLGAHRLVGAALQEFARRPLLAAAATLDARRHKGQLDRVAVALGVGAGRVHLQVGVAVLQLGDEACGAALLVERDGGDRFDLGVAARLWRRVLQDLVGRARFDARKTSASTVNRMGTQAFGQNCVNSFDSCIVSNIMSNPNKIDIKWCDDLGSSNSSANKMFDFF